MITFQVPGKPVAQSRPRFARRGNFVSVYDAAPAKSYKAWVAKCAEKAMSGMKVVPKHVPLALHVQVFLQRPKRLKFNDAAAVSKPDLDNYIKCLMDALTGVVYEADQQIVSIRAEKRYGDDPSVWVNIKEST